MHPVSLGCLLWALQIKVNPKSASTKRKKKDLVIDTEFLLREKIKNSADLILTIIIMINMPDKLCICDACLTFS